MSFSIFCVLAFIPPFYLTCSFPVCMSVGMAAAAETTEHTWIRSTHYPAALSPWSLHHFAAKLLGPIRWLMSTAFFCFLYTLSILCFLHLRSCPCLCWLIQKSPAPFCFVSCLPAFLSSSSQLKSSLPTHLQPQSSHPRYPREHHLSNKSFTHYFLSPFSAFGS